MPRPAQPQAAASNVSLLRALLRSAPSLSRGVTVGISLLRAPDVPGTVPGPLASNEQARRWVPTLASQAGASPREGGGAVWARFEIHRQKGFSLEPGPQSGFGHYQAQEVRTLAWLKSTTIF
jgi:hypothetical protein